MTSTKRPIAALYLRLSEETEDDRTETGASASIDRQKKDLIDLCDLEGWDVGPVYVDDGLTGRKERDKARQAVADLADGRVDRLVVWKWDRFGRRGARDLADVLDALAKNRNGLFVAHKDDLRSDQVAWEPMAGMIAWSAKRESENTAMRVSRAIRENKAAGRWTGGPAPYGYMRADNPSGPGSVLVVNPSEAVALTDAARAIVEGASIYSVTRSLNESGLRPRRARSWSIQAVTQALTGPAVVGRVNIKTGERRDPLTGKSVRTYDVIRNTDGTPRQVFPPAIPVDLWHTVRAILGDRAMEAPSAGSRRRGSRSRMLSGIAKCAGCGAPLYVRSNNAGNVSYRCGTRSNGRPCDTGAAVTVDALDAYVADAVLPVVGRLRIVVPVAGDRDTAALADVLESISETAEAFKDPGADYAALAARMASLQARKSELEAEAAASPKTTDFRETGETFADLWERADTSTRREHLSRIVEAVIVRSATRRGGHWHPLDPERVTVTWRADAMGAPDYLAGQFD